MTLRLSQNWLWDFWHVWQGDTCHLFYVQAPRSLGSEELRHHNATIGHAISPDLKNWTAVEDALHPGADGEWDDLATWTGSVIGHDGRWFMLYTGINRSEGGLVERIGLATSPDLYLWEKDPANPILEADARWYELLDLGSWYEQAWRDPWLFQDQADDSFHALITARGQSGAADARGVIGHARSSNLRDWDVLPPLSTPGGFGHLEVPQLAGAADRFFLLFSCAARPRA
jgi:beta-fructofuranosidase